MGTETERFKALLDEHHLWPTEYLFKFVVLAEQVQELKDILLNEELSFRSSKNGKYISVTLEKIMNSSSEVMTIYEKVWEVKGIISL
jgi:hypothetical protein